MLQTDFIAKVLDMEHMILKEVETFSNQIVLHVEMERRICECPACRTLTNCVHDYRRQRIKDSPIQGKHVIWLYRKRRYRCPCCGKRFYESNYLIPKWHRITNRLAMLTMQQLPKKRSRKEIAEDAGISQATVRQSFQTCCPSTNSKATRNTASFNVSSPTPSSDVFWIFCQPVMSVIFINTSQRFRTEAAYNTLSAICVRSTLPWQNAYSRMQPL